MEEDKEDEKKIADAYIFILKGITSEEEKEKYIEAIKKLSLSQKIKYILMLTGEIGRLESEAYSDY